MGRFFQAPTTQFVDDFLYKAPYELAMQVMAKKNQDVQTNIDTMELLRDLPIDRLDYHRDAASNIQKEIGGQIDTLAQNLSKDLLNSNNKYELRKLKREIHDRYNNGDIYNIQQSAKNYREFEKSLNDNKSLSEVDKQFYKKGYWDNYINANPEGGYDNIFQAGPTMRSINPIQEFADWWTKHGGTESVSNVFDKVNGRYVLKSTDNRTQKIVGDNFQKFLNANPEYEQIFKHRQDSGFFNERYYDNEGNLNIYDKNSTLYAQNELAQAMNTSSTTTGRELSADQYALENVRFGHDIAKMRMQASITAQANGTSTSDTGTPNTGTRVNKLLDSNYALQESLVKAATPIIEKYKKQYIKQNAYNFSVNPNLKQGFNTYNSNMPIPSSKQIIDMIIKDGGKNYGAVYNEIRPIYDKLNENMKASNELVANVWGKPDTAKFLTELNNMNNYDTQFYIGTESSSKEPGFSGNTTPSTMSIKDIHKNGINGTLVDPSKTKILKDRTVLVPVSSGDIKDDMVMFTYQFETKAAEGELPQVYEVPMYGDLRNYSQLPSTVDYKELQRRK